MLQVELSQAVMFLSDRVAAFFDGYLLSRYDVLGGRV